MKLKTFWKSICALIVALLIVMAFYRGPQSQWLMIGVVSVWAAFTGIIMLKSLLFGAVYALGSLIVNCKTQKEHGSKWK